MARRLGPQYDSVIDKLRDSMSPIQLPETSCKACNTKLLVEPSEISEKLLFLSCPRCGRSLLLNRNGIGREV